MGKGVIGAVVFLAISVILFVDLASEKSCSSPAVAGFIVVAYIIWLGVYEMIPTRTKYLGNLREFIALWIVFVGLIGSLAECL